MGFVHGGCNFLDLPLCVLCGVVWEALVAAERVKALLLEWAGLRGRPLVVWGVPVQSS